MTAALLRWAERLYIRAHGWTHTQGNSSTYEPPKDYVFKYKGPYVLQHAVNAQRLVNSAIEKRL